MALKDLIKSIGGKKDVSNMETKNDIARAIVTSENFLIIRPEENDLSKYRKVPLMEIAALGAAFSTLPEAARTITQTVKMGIDTKETLFVGYNQKGIEGFLRANEYGTVGNIMRVNEQGKQVIAGRMRFKPVEGGLPVTQTATTVIPFDPMTMVIAAALSSINQKLDTLQEKTEEILQFLKLEKQSSQRGNLNMLAEIMEEYRQDCTDEKMCSLRVVAVQDIKREAHKDILFYQEQIAAKLNNQKTLHGEQQAQSFLDAVVEEFAEYQLACYLYAFTSFMEVMLQKNFEKAALVAQKMEACAKRYTELYTACHTQIANYQRTTIEAQMLGSIGKVVKSAGQALASVPVLSRGTVDEALINAGEALGKHNKEAVAQKLQKFEPMEDNRMSAFIENVWTMELLYNRSDAMITDGESLYILEATA